MRDIALGLALGALWILLFLFFEALWSKYGEPHIYNWIYRRAEKRLVATGHFTPEEAKEEVKRWREEEMARKR